MARSEASDNRSTGQSCVSCPHAWGGVTDSRRGVYGHYAHRCSTSAASNSQGERSVDKAMFHLLKHAQRRLATIIMLLLPSALSTPQMTGFLRQRRGQTAETPWLWLASILDSRAWKVCSKLHIIAFMFSGRFFEFGRRLGGLQYVRKRQGLSK